MDLVLHFDGGGYSSGGPGGWGAVLSWPDGTVVDTAYGSLADATNNEAEYEALLGGLRLAFRYAPVTSLRICGDSRLIIDQVTGRMRVRNVKLRVLNVAATRMLASVPHATLEWVPRDENREADKLATKGFKEAKAKAGYG